MPEKLILKTHLSPGDIVTLTAAVRDLHVAYPGRFLTDIRTSADSLFEHSPFITKLHESESRIIDMEYPLIHYSNRRPYHFLQGYTMFLEEKLGLKIPTTDFRGDIHLSNDEKSWMSQVAEDDIGWDKDFWILNAGYKTDFTNKYWGHDRYQAVVDHFAGKIQFVQVGENSRNHIHPQLNGVISLVGKTNTRQLVRLIHHAAGVLCGVTFVMHLAAAVPVREGMPPHRACVVLAGGREPLNWLQYPNHRVLNTNGCLPCCDNGGCWKSRVEPINDDSWNDKSLCLNVVNRENKRFPKCMDIISTSDVIREIEMYHSCNYYNYL